MVVIRPRTLKEIYDLISDELSDFYESSALTEVQQTIIKAFVGFTKEEKPSNIERIVDEKRQQLVRTAIKELKKYKPIEYVLGFKKIGNYDFLINENTSIPKNQTGDLIKRMINDILKDYFYKTKRQFKILDIGTGCGCIAVSLKKGLMKAKITGIDINDAIIDLAKENNKYHNTDVKFVKADLFDKKNMAALEKFDLIVSNPPYISETEKVYSEFAPYFHEPEDAIFVKGENTLLFYETIINLGKEKLFDEGKIYFEINDENAVQVRDMLKSNGYKRINIIKNQNEEIVGITAIFELEEEIHESKNFNTASDN